MPGPRLTSTLKESQNMRNRRRFPVRKSTCNAFGHEVNNPIFKLEAPPKAVYKTQPTKSSFSKYYDRGDFPVKVAHNSTGNRIMWTQEMEELDLHFLLPVFFDGLKETRYPYNFFARQGCHDLLEHGGERILPVIPQLIIPIKEALETRDRLVMCATLKVVQHLIVSHEMVGQMLVPYYRQLLPLMRYYRDQNNNLGDGIDYGQMRRDNLGDLINETLQGLETHGGPDAYLNMKYIIPDYESTVSHNA